jgi:hypothetical protein
MQLRITTDRRKVSGAIARVDIMQIIFAEVALYDSNAGVVCFHGSTDNVRISFGCTREALMVAEHLTSASEADLMVAFTKHREHIQEIARAKYVAGALEKKGVCIVKSVDLNR